MLSGYRVVVSEKALYSLTNLKYLELAFCKNLHNTDLNTLSNLEQLNLIVYDVDLELLKNFKTLKHLDVSSSGINIKNLRKLRNLFDTTIYRDRGSTILSRNLIK